MLFDGDHNDWRYATVDHVKAVKDGGGDGIDNLRLACRGCNCGRHNEAIFRIQAASRAAMAASTQRRSSQGAPGVA